MTTFRFPQDSFNNFWQNLFRLTKLSNSELTYGDKKDRLWISGRFSAYALPHLEVTNDIYILSNAYCVFQRPLRSASASVVPPDPQHISRFGRWEVLFVN